MNTTTKTALRTAKTARAEAREALKEALRLQREALKLLDRAAKLEAKAATLATKEKAAALAAKEKAKAMKPVKPAGVIVTNGVGRKITLPVTVADVFQKTLGKRRHGSFLLSSVEADDIVEALGENVSLTHGNFTVQFPRGNPLLFTVERDELLTWNTVPRVARKTA